MARTQAAPSLPAGVISMGAYWPRLLTAAPTDALQTRATTGKHRVSSAGRMVELIALNPDAPAVNAAAEKLYADLQAAGVDVFYDDRDERPGVKFNDADLIGFPVRVVVGKKGVEQGQAELSLRRDRAKVPVPLGDAVAKAKELLEAP